MSKYRRNLGPTTRAYIYKRDGYTCYLCGVEAPESDLTVDHVVPISLGGTNTLDNMKAAHLTCNNIKNNLTLDEFKEVVSRVHKHLTRQLVSP